MDLSVFQFISATIENATNDFLVGGLTGLMDALAPFILISVTIYIIGLGYLQIFGKSDDILFDVIKHCLVVTCITGLALNIDNYTTYIIGGVESLASGLASAISGQSQNTNIYQNLDQLLQKGIEQAGYSFSQVDWPPTTWTWMLIGIIVLTAIGSLTLVSATIIIGTKFLLTFLLILGPLFFIFACFPITRRYLDSWIAKVFENVLVQVLGIMVITLAIETIQVFIRSNNINGVTETDANTIGIAVQIVIVVGILLFVIRQIPNLAGSLAGGFASASMSIKDLKSGATAGVAGLASTGKMIDRFNGNEPSERSQRDTWEQQQANKITSGNSNQSRDPVSQVVRDQIEKHNRMNK
ncbi:type IV secretion system protein (plasmid) [Photobacterium leiognathi subsp. mandapamensis]|uniref:type IV secretion system protein n=1 Tax=Photobacterium leiognathi TaxID=553611 RepID=UPI003AF33D78